MMSLSTYENRPYNHWHTYTSFGSDIDLLADSNGPPSSRGQPARRIDVLEEGSGTLSVRLGSGATKTETVTAGDVSAGHARFEPVFVTAILAATNVGKIRVFW